MSSTCSGERYGDWSRAGAWAKVQYPHLPRHSMVRGMNTFGDHVIRVPVVASRTEAAAASRSGDGTVSRSCDMDEPYCGLKCCAWVGLLVRMCPYLSDKDAHRTRIRRCVGGGANRRRVGIQRALPRFESAAASVPRRSSPLFRRRPRRGDVDGGGPPARVLLWGRGSLPWVDLHHRP